MKIVAGAMYVHKSNLEELLLKLDKNEKIYVLDILNKTNVNYTIIKYYKGNISLIECDTFDTLKEPIVGDSYLYKKDGTIKKIKGGTKIYHSKELFVADDYKGFDIEKAKQRTIEWNKIPNIKEVKSKIGNYIFWQQLLKENGLEC